MEERRADLQRAEEKESAEVRSEKVRALFIDLYNYFRMDSGVDPIVLFEQLCCLLIQLSDDGLEFDGPPILFLLIGPLWPDVKSGIAGGSRIRPLLLTGQSWPAGCWIQPTQPGSLSETENSWSRRCSTFWRSFCGTGPTRRWAPHSAPPGRSLSLPAMRGKQRFCQLLSIRPVGAGLF